MRGKKFLCGLLAAGLLFGGSTFPITSFADETANVDVGEATSTESFKYTIDDGKVNIEKYIGKETNVVIPSEIDGAPVTSIDSDAFLDSKTVISVTIPAVIEDINGNIFAWCPLLREITVAEDNKSFTSVDGVLFNKDKTLLIAYPRDKEGSYIIPEGVKTLENLAFCGCEKLSSVTIAQSVEQIGVSSFEDCDMLALAVIPNNVRIVAWRAFMNCDLLASVEIQEGVTEIGNLAFKYCSSLTSVNIPKSVTFLGDGVFDGTPVMDALPGTIKYLDNWVIGADSSEEDEIGIEDGTFGISCDAFFRLKKLAKLTMPESVKVICFSAFENTTALTDVYYGGSEASWKEIEIGRSNDPLLNATIHFDKTEDEPKPSNPDDTSDTSNSDANTSDTSTPTTDTSDTSTPTSDTSETSTPTSDTSDTSAPTTDTSDTSDTSAPAESKPEESAPAEETPEAPAEVVLAAPEAFKLKTNGTTSVSLSWSKVDGATGYTVQQKSGKSWKTVVEIKNGSTTTAKITKLKAGKSYEFRICANGVKDSEYAALTVVTKPTKVEGLKVSKNAKTSLTLKWKKNTSATGYQIQQKVGKKWKTVKTITKNKTVTAKISKLKKKTAYKFRVRAYRIVGKTKTYSAYATASGKTK